VTSVWAVVTAVVKSAPALYVSVGDAAKAAESENFVPFDVEATGALGPSAKARSNEQRYY
jgi:hypothetical protein